MKYKEFHKLIQKQGWRIKRQTGSHVFYEKNGKIYPVPYHGSKEVAKGLEIKIRKDMGL